MREINSKAPLRDLYWRFAEPEIPSDYKKVGYEYQGFFLQRDTEHLLWTVKMEDGSTPIPLQSKYTTHTKAKDAVDGWLAEERKQQEKHRASVGNT
jgi:hypothetical protein